MIFYEKLLLEGFSKRFLTVLFLQILIHQEQIKKGKYRKL